MVAPGDFCGYGRQGPRTVRNRNPGKAAHLWVERRLNQVHGPMCRLSADTESISSVSLRGMCYQARNVPIRTFLEHDHSFGPEDIANLSAAFEAARSKLGLVDRTDPATMAVAKLIIEFAKEGERDAERLW